MGRQGDRKKLPSKLNARTIEWFLIANEILARYFLASIYRHIYHKSTSTAEENPNPTKEKKKRQESNSYTNAIRQEEDPSTG